MTDKPRYRVQARRQKEPMTSFQAVRARDALAKTIEEIAGCGRISWSCVHGIEMDRAQFFPNKDAIRQVFERLGVVFHEGGSIYLGNPHRKITAQGMGAVE